jgi:hypothetical protein
MQTVSMMKRPSVLLSTNNKNKSVFLLIGFELGLVMLNISV